MHHFLILLHYLFVLSALLAGVVIPCGLEQLIVSRFSFHKNHFQKTFCGKITGNQAVSLHPAKKKKKESKGKFQFQKVKFRPCGLLIKSPPIWFVFYQKNLTSFETFTRETTFFFLFQIYRRSLKSEQGDQEVIRTAFFQGKIAAQQVLSFCRCICPCKDRFETKKAFEKRCDDKETKYFSIHLCD